MCDRVLIFLLNISHASRLSDDGADDVVRLLMLMMMIQWGIWRRTRLLVTGLLNMVVGCDVAD